MIFKLIIQIANIIIKWSSLIANFYNVLDLLDGNEHASRGNALGSMYRSWGNKMGQQHVSFSNRMRHHVCGGNEQDSMNRRVMRCSRYRN